MTIVKFILAFTAVFMLSMAVFYLCTFLFGLVWGFGLNVLVVGEQASFGAVLHVLWIVCMIIFSIVGANEIVD